MTDPQLIAKKLAELETYVRELHDLGRPDRIRQDLVQRRFIEHSLQHAVQTALDVASHVVSDERLGEPSTNRELFEILGRAGLLDGELAARLSRMAGFRNILVHNYAAVDLGVLEDVLRHRLDDLNDFAEAIRRLLPEV